MTKRTTIIILLLLVVAAGGIAAHLWSPRERQKQIRAFTDVPAHFVRKPLEKLDEPMKGEWGEIKLARGAPSLRFTVEEHWAEMSFLEADFARAKLEGGKAVYEGIYPDTNLEYEMYDGYVLQTLVLNGSRAPKEFIFRLRVSNGLEPGEIMGGFVPLYRTGSQEQVMQVRQAVAVDSRGVPYGYKYTVEPKGNSEYELRLFPSEPAHFASAQYPITINPAIQSSAWDEVLVKVGENGNEEGNLMDGDIADIHPAGWGWGVEERKKFVVVMVPKLTIEERARFLSLPVNRREAWYGIDYTKLVGSEELTRIRSKKFLNSFIDARHIPSETLFVKKSDRLGSAVPDDKRFAYQPPRFPLLAKLAQVIVRPVFAADTKKIAQGGGNNCPSGTACDYSTLQLWEDGEDGVLATEEIGSTYNDGGNFTGSVYVGGSTTSASNFMHLTAASGERHNGTAGTGVKVLWTSTGDWSCVIEAGDGYTQVSWLEVDMSNVTNAGNVGICSQSGTGIKFYNNIIHDRNSGGSSKLIWAKNSTSNITVYNNILYDSDVDGIYAENSATITAYNNTIYNVSRSGFYNSASTITARNNIVLTCGSTCNQDVTTQSYNMASDTSAAGTGSINSETASSEFTSITSGSENLHLKTGANAINAGTDLSGTFTTDVDNQTRSGTWDMGADETNTAPTISSVSDSPDPVTVGSSISFSTSWSDVNGDSIKVKICKTNALSAQNCTGGSWATSTAFTATTPEAPSYTAQSADIATSPNSYYAFVCDTYAGCSSSTSGTFTVQAANATPTITSVTDTPDPVGAGDAIAFSVDWNDTDSGETVKVKICKTNALSAQNCTGGSWATSTAFTTSDPESVSYTTSGSDVGTQNYYAFVCDDSAACSSSTSGTFTVQSATPSITSVSDTPDPTNPGRSVSFIVDWSDANSGETLKAKVCKTDALSAQNCSGGYWATSTAFTTLDPEKVVYDVIAGDAGQTRSYYAFVCDDDANCSSSSSGTFSVNVQSTVPNIKVRGGLKVR